MGLLGGMKLKKLTVKAYEKPERSGKHINEWEAMFNPSSFSQKYEVEYAKKQALNSSDSTLRYSYSKPRTVNLKLVLDGTGVHEMGIFQLGSPQTVSKRVRDFFDMAIRMNGVIHEPNYLVVEWGGETDGGLKFPCRFASADVSYTTFNRDGSPLRAEIQVALISDEEIQKRIAKDGKSSPDLTHTRTVKSGDTLPLLTKEIYGSSAYYLRVAEVNGLNDFRNLVPGQELFFPPLENETTSQAPAR